MPKVVIVGAGISGLALAFRLQQLAPDAELIVLEARGRPGGTVWTERRDGFAVEIGPNGFLDTKPSTLALSRDVGLGQQICAASESSVKNRYIFVDGKLQALPNSIGSFLCSPLLSWRGKLRLLSERFRRARSDTADESIDAFVRRRAGVEAANVLADALVTGIHAGDPALLSAAAAFPRLVEFENRYGSVIKGMTQTVRQRRTEAAARGEPYQRSGKMWSFQQGLRLLIETLDKKLLKPPLYGVNVLRIEEGATNPVWQIIGEGGDRWSTDAVVLTCPAYAQAQMLGDLDGRLAEQIAGIAYNRVAVIALGYRQEDVPIPLAGFGFIVPQRSRRDILGVQWCSSIYADRAPAGHVLLRVMSGGWNRPEIVSWDDNRLLQAVQAELRLTMGITTAPVFHHIVRWDRAIPQYHLGHLSRVATIERLAASHPGLFLGGNPYHGVALNDCTEQADLLAGKVAAFLKAK
jgi:oxygen-dependent protoporphyrinogen oxidase